MDNNRKMEKTVPWKSAHNEGKSTCRMTYGDCVVVGSGAERGMGEMRLTSETRDLYASDFGLGLVGRADPSTAPLGGDHIIRTVKKEN